MDAPRRCQPAFAVCDGVGGQAKGEVASRTVADAIGEYMQKADLGKPFGAEDFRKVLDHAYARLEKAMSRDTRDMATTMTFVAFHGGGVFCAHMGDSRIYHVRPGVGILYRSDDHSLVNALVHSGLITPEEAIDHPQSNVITRCLTYVEPDHERPAATSIQITDVQPGDYFFLCSDGVVHCVDDDQLLAILSSDEDDGEKIRQLAEMSRNSADNNTAYLIGIEDVAGNTLPREEAGKEETQNSNTARITSPGKVTQDISPSAPKSGKLTNFFKSLFK